MSETVDGQVSGQRQQARRRQRHHGTWSTMAMATVRFIIRPLIDAGTNTISILERGTYMRWGEWGRLKPDGRSIRYDFSIATCDSDNDVVG